jgi:hypothetical protein
MTTANSDSPSFNYLFYPTTAAAAVPLNGLFQVAV